MESEGRKKSNMAKTYQDMELPECFHASTEASLQRFTRGQSSMVNLHKLLKDHAKMEKKVGQIYDEFVVKWKDRALAQIGSNLAYDEVNSLMKIWMATYKEKQDLHNKLLDTMYAQDGPLRNLQDYINSEEVIAKRKAIQFLYERARKSQVKVEKEIDQLKEDFFLTKDKMVHFKPQMDAAQIRQDPHTNFRELLAHWRKLEADVDGAKTSYRQKLQKEKSTRTTFIEDMKRYQNDSDAYERARLQKLQDVMTAMMQCSKTVETQRHEILEPLFEEGISCLDQYNMQKEIDLYNVFYLYQHKFPKEEPHPSEMPSKKAEDDESLQKTPKVDPSVELDIV
ncbi:uncharacterized protein LOC124145751 [Haliotis rufescens]|uniref:uncharacterized protein LOC124145751 n=1 Tax=Haliotis rufescens TaxID=6454 RepID=UPI00201F6936|nr:uncharacterized protein LOC124145751 [Haliotis rufescens]